MSDLHLEMHRDDGREFLQQLVPKAETLVLAGDITMARRYEDLREVFGAIAPRWRNILYVLGNHEYYKSSPSEVARNVNRLKEEFPNVAILTNRIVTIDGQRFIGGTMWFALNERAAAFRLMMNDFNVIDDFEPWVYNENHEFVDTVMMNLRPDDVVITHHLPSPKSISRRFRGNALNDFFLHDMTGLIEAVQPRLWIHGHTHDRFDYKIGPTRVVCNPHGYPSEMDSIFKFSENFVVKLTK